MATGAPDWQGQRWKVEAVQRPNLLFPSGKVIYWDDFESPTLKWEKAGSAGYSIELNTDYVATGTTALKLVTDDDDGDTAYVNKYLGAPASQKLGLEANFTLSEVDWKHVQFVILAYDGTNYYNAILRYVRDGEKWQYYNTTPAFADIPGGAQSLLEKDECFHRFKMTIDTSTGKYTRLKCNNLSIDLSALSIYSTGSPSHGHMVVRFLIATDGAWAATSYLDNVAITEE